MKHRPSEMMITHLREADRKRLRIVAWRINIPAWSVITEHEQFLFESEEPREFMGIPVDRVCDFAREPLIEPIFETHGGKLMVHDYDGPILHGNAHSRFLAKQSQNSDSAEVRTQPP